MGISVKNVVRVTGRGGGYQPNIGVQFWVNGQKMLGNTGLKTHLLSCSTNHFQTFCCNYSHIVDFVTTTAILAELKIPI